MKTIKYALTLITILLTLITCGDNGVDPPEIEPGSRNYEWREDTLDTGNEFVTLSRIWANTPDDVWALGFGGRENIWHYDGESWKNDPTSLNIVNPTAIYGFRSNNVWVGTSENAIWRYNGTEWSLFQTLSLDGFFHVVIEDMWGKSPNNVYGVGFARSSDGVEFNRAVIVHYNGTEWDFMDIPELRKTIFFKLEYQSSTDQIFILSNFNDGPLDIVYAYDGNELIEITSSNDGFGMGRIGSEVYINSEQIIYKYKNNKFSLWKDFTGTTFMANINGRSEKDFFNAAIDGIGHYNGTNYKTIYKTQLDINGHGVFDRDMFFITKDKVNNHSIVIHGILKD